MVLIKEVASFILLMILSKIFVSGGQIYNPSEFERVNERRSGINYEQKNIGVPTWEDPNYAVDYNNNPYRGVPQYQGYPPITTTSPRSTTVGLNSRNNFGDLPVKCGPNQEKIHGECQDV